MKAYPISQNEINQFSLLNDLSTAFFSIGMVFASIGMEKFLDLPPEITINRAVLYCAFFALVLFVAGGVMVFKRQGVIDQIKSECVES